MKLPINLVTTPGTKAHAFYSQRLARQIPFGITPEKVVFGDDVLSANQAERQAVIDLLKGLDNGGETGLGKMANDPDYPLTVINSWHTSDSDSDEHLTIRRANGKICHVYIDGNYTCW
jgi:hypothetical protein